MMGRYTQWLPDGKGGRFAALAPELEEQYTEGELIDVLLAELARLEDVYKADAGKQVVGDFIRREDAIRAHRRGLYDGTICDPSDAEDVLRQVPAVDVVQVSNEVSRINLALAPPRPAILDGPGLYLFRLEAESVVDRYVLAYLRSRCAESVTNRLKGGDVIEGWCKLADISDVVKEETVYEEE